MADQPEYTLEMRPGRPLKIVGQDGRIVVKFMSGGWVKFADDMTDDERTQFSWAVELQKKLDHRGQLLAKLQAVADQAKQLRQSADVLDEGVMLLGQGES